MKVDIHISKHEPIKYRDLVINLKNTKLNKDGDLLFETARKPEESIPYFLSTSEHLQEEHCREASLVPYKVHTDPPIHKTCRKNSISNCTNLKMRKDGIVNLKEKL